MNRNAAVLTLSIVFAGPVLADKLAREVPEEPVVKMAVADAVAVLEQSSDWEKVKTAAIALARSDDAEAAGQLVRLLAQPAVRRRLNPPEKSGHFEIRGTYRVLLALCKASTRHSESVMLRLFEDKSFADDPDLSFDWSHAVSFLGKPSGKIVIAVEEGVKKEAFTVSSAVYALAAFGTSESAPALERLFRSPIHTAARKSGWVTRPLMMNRNALANVRLFHRLIQENPADGRFRNLSVQALFDYRPRDWWGQYRELGEPQPPDRREASDEALKAVLEAADATLKLDITDVTRAGVVKAKAEIEGILRERAAKKKP